MSQFEAMRRCRVSRCAAIATAIIRFARVSYKMTMTRLKSQSIDIETSGFHKAVLSRVPRT